MSRITHKHFRAQLQVKADGKFVSKKTASTADLSVRILARCDDATGVDVERALIDALISVTKDTEMRDMLVSLRGLGDQMDADEQESALIEVEQACKALLDQRVLAAEHAAQNLAAE